MVEQKGAADTQYGRYQKAAWRKTISPPLTAAQAVARSAAGYWRHHGSYVQNMFSLGEIVEAEIMNYALLLLVLLYCGDGPIMSVEEVALMLTMTWATASTELRK